MSEPNQKGLKLPSFPARYRRRPPVVDMLPYAGVAFILLSAFTVTSEMTRPPVLELIDPCPVDGCWEIAEIQIHIRHDDSLFLSYRLDPRLYAAGLDTIQAVAAEQIVDKPDRLLITIFVDPATSYGRVADVLGRLNRAEAETSEAVRARREKRVRRLRILPISQSYARYDGML